MSRNYTHEDPNLPHGGVLLEIVLDKSIETLDLGISTEFGDNLGFSSYSIISCKKKVPRTVLVTCE